MKTRDDIRDDLPLYALDGLDAEDRAAVEAALAGDAELARELREWREVVGLLALDAPNAAPPDLKDQLLARVRGAAAPAPAPVAGRVARRRLGGWTAALAAAAAAVFAIATYREIGHRAELARARQTLAGLQEGLRATQHTLETVNATLAQREDDVNALRLALAQAEATLAVLQQPNLQMVALRETADAPPAAGHVLLSPPSGKALFYAFDLPPVPPNKVYELWWITEKDGPVRAAVFRPDARGVGRVEATVPAGAGALQAAAVTVERAGGVPKPEGPMVLLGQVKS